jgi:hypothetical protein
MITAASDAIADTLRNVTTILCAAQDRWRIPDLLETLPLTALLPSIDRSVSVGRKRSAHALWPSLRFAEAILRRLPGVSQTCLYASLTRYAALRRAGIEPTFVLGVRTDRGDLEGHAWTEVDGEPWHDASARSYTVTFRHLSQPMRSPSCATRLTPTSF